jgi:hypothetical protein
MDHRKDSLGPGVDQPVKGTILSAHMSDMSNPKKMILMLAFTTLILTAATGCSDGQRTANTDITPESRAAYEQTHFDTPDGKLASSLEVARLAAETKADSAAAGGVANTLLNPQKWQAQAHAKLCEYTTTLMNNADRDGTVVSARTRAAAKLILDRC